MQPERAHNDAHADEASSIVRLMVDEADQSDSDRGVIRVDLSVLSSLQANVGDVLKLTGRTNAYARVLPLPKYLRGKRLAQLDTTLRHNAGVSLGEEVEISLAEVKHARHVILVIESMPFSPTASFEKQLPVVLENFAVDVGDRLKVRLTGGRNAPFTVKQVEPSGPVLISPDTAVKIERNLKSHNKAQTEEITYKSLGGLERELGRVREMIELPMKRADLFDHLGIEPPRGVLLSGPPGTGKTLLARAVANECDASFYQINGPEIVAKHYGESEKQLREIFERAQKDQPAVIFIDELDAIAPNRETLAGDRQVERRIVGQLLTLMDGLTSRGQVVVMAATNLPNTLDPALRRPGRFDREIVFNVPDKYARREILQIHTTHMPLGKDVSLDELASITHGYVGADLASLAREAGMAALRRFSCVDEDLDALEAADVHVLQGDFMQAHTEIVPSALREVFTDIPETKWDDVGGHENIKQALIESVVWPLKHGDIFGVLNVTPNKGVLLTGQPGTGKTLLAKTLASESGVSFISVRGPQLLSQYIGESERAVRDVFHKARLSAPCILFFDEIEALLPVRGTDGSAVLDRVVAQFLTEIDGIDDLKGVFVLAATNRPDQVDPAVLRPGRFDLTLEVTLPDKATRKRIFDIHTKDMRFEKAIDLHQIAETLPQVSGAQIEAICRQAALKAVRRCIRENGNEYQSDPVISQNDISVAIAEVLQTTEPGEVIS